VPVLKSFPEDGFTSSGNVAEHLTRGVSKLLMTNAPLDRRRPLRAEAVRLVPGSDAVLPVI
jgi:hypothetical protein